MIAGGGVAEDGVAELLSIGDIAHAVGLKVSAIRYYDDLGLVEATARVGGKRRYHPDAIGRIAFVQRSRDAGFSLDEIGELLNDTDGGWRDLVDAKLIELHERRDRLDVVIDTLQGIRDCGCEAAVLCPIVAPQGDV